MAPYYWIRPDDSVQELPEEPSLEITNQAFFPTVHGRRMRHATYLPMFISYVLFKDDQRYLLREEVVLMMKSVFYGEHFATNNGVFEDFEDHESRVSKAYLSLDDASIRPWSILIEGWLGEIRQKYKLARDIEKALRGL